MFTLDASSLSLQIPPLSATRFFTQSHRFSPILRISFPAPRTHYHCLQNFLPETQEAPTKRVKRQILLPTHVLFGESDGVYDGEDGDDEFAPLGGFGKKDEEKDYDKDPEFAEIIGSSLDDPEKARSKIEDRLRKKKNKILHTKTGSAIPMKVKFNKFDFNNSYIWFEFYHAPLEKDVSLICNAIRAWHIVGRLGGCNSMNMQLSQSLLDRRPSYDSIQGANVTPTTFYNIGDFEIQDNLARIWVDIGTSEPLLLDILINSLTQISSDYVGIKQVVFGGSEFENWKDNLTSEDAGYSVHRI